MITKPPRWTFSIREQSAGCYVCEAFGDRGGSISKMGFEDVIPELLREAFLAECAHGTIPGTAAFSVTSGFKPFWGGEYRDEVFGSWIWQSESEPRRVVYDGRDFHLAAYRGKDSSPVWQGHIRELSEPTCQYFNNLVYL